MKLFAFLVSNVLSFEFNYEMQTQMQEICSMVDLSKGADLDYHTMTVITNSMRMLVSPPCIEILHNRGQTGDMPQWTWPFCSSLSLHVAGVLRPLCFESCHTKFLDRFMDCLSQDSGVFWALSDAWNLDASEVMEVTMFNINQFVFKQQAYWEQLSNWFYFLSNQCDRHIDDWLHVKHIRYLPSYNHGIRTTCYKSRFKDVCGSWSMLIDGENVTYDINCDGWIARKGDDPVKLNVMTDVRTDFEESSTFSLQMDYSTLYLTMINITTSLDHLQFQLCDQDDICNQTGTAKRMHYFCSGEPHFPRAKFKNNYRTAKQLPIDSRPIICHIDKHSKAANPQHVNLPHKFNQNPLTQDARVISIQNYTNLGYPPPTGAIPISLCQSDAREYYLPIVKDLAMKLNTRWMLLGGSMFSIAREGNLFPAWEDDLDFTLEHFSQDLISKIRYIYPGPTIQLQPHVYAKFLNYTNPAWQDIVLIYSHTCPTNVCRDHWCEWWKFCKHLPSFIIIHNLKTGTIAESISIFAGTKQRFWEKHPPVTVQTIDGKDIVNVPFYPNNPIPALWDDFNQGQQNLLEGYIMPGVINGIIFPVDNPMVRCHRCSDVPELHLQSTDVGDGYVFTPEFNVGDRLVTNYSGRFAADLVGSVVKQCERIYYGGDSRERFFVQWSNNAKVIEY